MKTFFNKTILLVLLMPAVLTQIQAQPVGCAALNLSIEEINTCTYRLYFNNSAPDCFQQMTLLIDSGEFGNWSPNTAGGWNVAPLSATELEVSHDNGLFPAGPGYILDVQIDLTASATLTVLYYYDCPLGEGCAADFPVAGCPDPQDASIIGVKYKECGILPFTNQTPLAGWTIQLFDQDDNLLAEDVTDSTGAYGFFDLLGGVYTVREVQQPGWTPKVPASGEYLIDLDASEQRTVNYGNCPPPKPPCNCPTGTQPAAVNLVQNGDFSGSGGFSSGYAQNNNNPPLQPGQYWIGSNPNTINPGFADCGDHTGGGNMLVVNGAPSPNTPIWCQTVTVTPNTTYMFEAWAASLTSASPANLSLFVIINSLNVQYEVGRFYPSATPCDWQRWCETWQTGNYTSITLCLYDLNPTAAGNDFALDDISFRRCVNPVAEVTGVLYESCDSLPYTDQPVLAGWTVQLLDTLGNVLDTTVTDGNGAYAFGSLPPANYYARAVVQPDWTPVTPPFGFSLIELEAGEEAVQHFGMCHVPVLPCACPVPYSPGANLETNSDFSVTGGFYSAYTLNINNPPLLSGQCWFGDNPQDINSNFQPCTDHTTGSGNMLVVYGTPWPGIATYPILRNTYPVAKNTTYLFSIWTAPVTSDFFGWAGLSATANGMTVGTFSYVISNPPVCTWKRICGTWYSDQNTSVTLDVNAEFFNFSPHDVAIALDDISFRPCSLSAVGNVSGVIFRSCDTLPYSDQPKLADWPVQLLDTLGNLIGEQVTDSTGAYAFADLPPGNYVVKTVVQPGWHPNVPASGQVAVNLGGGEAVVENFGMCPECSCDSIEIIPYQVQNPSDTALYLLSMSNPSPYCFSYIQIELDTIGEFIGWDSLPPGWTVELLNPKLLQLHWAEPQLPVGSYLPVLLKAKGEGEQRLTVTTFWDGGNGEVPCVQNFDYPVPTGSSMCCAIDPGTNNLIQNGDFGPVQANYNFWDSDYVLGSSLFYGEHFVTSDPSYTQNFPDCGDHTNTSSTGQMLVVNGALDSKKRVWYTSNVIPVQPSTDYVFHFYHTSLSNLNKPNFGVSIGGYKVTTNINGAVCDWVGYCVKWRSGPNTYGITISIKDLTTALFGNEFALDDMWFFPCPLPCQADFNFTPINSCGKAQFTNTSTNLPADVQYCWDFDNNPATCESTAASPMWQFPTCGTYNVSLTLSGTNCSSSTSHPLTVIDNTNPTAVCLPGAGYDMGNNCTLAVTPAMIDGGSYDNCQIASMSVSPNQIPCGVSTVTLTVTDWCGNTGTCTTDIQAAEFVPPTALCQPSMAIDVGNACTLALTPSMIDAGSYDNCQLAGMSVDPALITCGGTTVTLTVTDWCGNTDACTTDIYIGEGEPPMIFCPIGISANCNLNVGPDVAGVANAVDNCTPPIKIEYSYSDVVFGTPDCDDYIERTWVAKDLCGNTSSCVQVISVNDIIPPDITNCPPSLSANMDPGQCHHTYTPPNLTVTDNCDPSPTLSCFYEEPSGTIWPLTGTTTIPKGLNTIRCTATDDCGNVSALCTYTLDVVDNQPPTLTCPQNVTVQSTYNAAGLCEAVVNNLAPTVTDNCPIMSLDYAIAPSSLTGQNDASGTLFEGVSTVTYTAMDCGGFTKTCSFTVSVLCPPCVPVIGAPCAVAQNVTVDCITGVFGQYDFSFEVLNQSGFNADRIELTAVTPFGAITQTVFNVNVANNASSGLLTTTLNGVPGATVCFKISLLRLATNGVVLECCETAQICVTLPECPGPCNCAGADNLNFTFTGITPNVSWPGPVAVTCGNQTPFQLPCIPYGETPFAFHGVVHCDADDCLFNTIDYEVTDPAGVVVLPGGSLPLAVIGQDGYFDIYNLSANSLVPGVTYTLTLTWYCGGKICKCEVKFQTSVCDCQCIYPVTNVAISSGTLTLSAPCGSTLSQGIPCPPAGNFVTITGKFVCIGTECLPGKIVRYTLTGPNGPVTTGAVLATPFFSISLLPQQMYAVGQYTITMTGECNGQPCAPCTFSFFHQCPEPCPCPDATFNNRVDQGFTVASTGIACKACFIPKQLGPCETVEWFVNGVGPIGSPTVGNAPFCHTFSSTAIYQIEMRVTRQKTNGTFCAQRSKTLNIKILCDPQNSPCSADVVSNPGFDVGPEAGGLNTGGAAPGWTGAFGDPVVTEGSGALDGWSIMLSGNREAADVLSRESALCWVKDTGTIALRLQVWGINHIAATGGQKPGETLTLRLYRGDVPNPLTDSCDGVNCLELVSILPFPPDSGDWFTLEIPYDLTGWAAVDSCGEPVPDPQGVLVRPVAYVTNWLGEESGDEAETRSMILIDNFCFDGQLVGVKDLASKGRIRIFPNPNPGQFTVELPEPAAPGLRLRVVGLTGQVLWENAAEAGSSRQTVQAGDLPAGLYFLQVISEGKVLAVAKFVKE